MGFATRDKWVGVGVPRHADQVLDGRVVRLQIFVGDGPIRQRVVLRQRLFAEALAHMGEVLKVMRMTATQCATPMNDGAADTVHHTSERESCLPGRLTLVAPPA